MDSVGLAKGRAQLQGYRNQPPGCAFAGMRAIYEGGRGFLLILGKLQPTLSEGQVGGIVYLFSLPLPPLHFRGCMRFDLTIVRSNPATVKIKTRSAK